MPRILDLTQPLGPETRVFPGYPPPLVHKWSTYCEDGYYANFVFMNEHSGTHMDSPAHFVPGAPTIDELPPEKFVARAVVLRFVKSPGERITWSEVEEALSSLDARVGPGWYVLFALGWDRVDDEDWLRYPYLDEDAARGLARLGIEGIGLDSPSPDYEPYMVHKILLPQGIVIVENMARLVELHRESPVVDQLIVAPLPIRRGSASPVRALAVIER